MVVNAQLILYVIAFVCFLGGVLDHPRVSGVRCIALGLALLVIAQITGTR